MKLYNYDINDIIIVKNKSQQKLLEKNNIFPINKIKRLFYMEYHYIKCEETLKILQRG